MVRVGSSQLIMLKWSCHFRIAGEIIRIDKVLLLRMSSLNRHLFLYQALQRACFIIMHLLFVIWLCAIKPG